MYTSSAGSRAELSILCDSGAVVVMNFTPFISDLINKHTINWSCTFGNKAQLRASAMETIQLEEVKVHRKEEQKAATLKGALWIMVVNSLNQLPNKAIFESTGMD